MKIPSCLLQMLAFMLTIQLIHCVDKSKEKVIDTPLGRIRGLLLETRPEGPKFLAFRGIRYATAERFKVAKPYRWEETYDATSDFPACPQYNYTRMSEDCLSLNIYIREDAFNKETKLPVMVYLHGGGFNTGSNSMDFSAGPHYLMEHEESVVFVAVNSRLNIFGYICTGTKEAPGNLGLKDQVLALKWIKENIEGFGGSSEVITLIGHGSGAESVGLHMVSPMSRNLFKRAIMMSGSPTTFKNVFHDRKESSFLLARKFGCHDKNHILKCLKHVPIEALVKNLLDWAPVVEPNFGQEIFLPADPEILMQKFPPKVQLLAGFTLDELAHETEVDYRRPNLLDQLNNDFDSLAPKIFGYEHIESHKQISGILRNTTFGDKPIDNSNFEGLQQLNSESQVKIPVYRMLIQMMKSNSTVYAYQYSYLGHKCQHPMSDKLCYKVNHGDDALHLLTQNKRIPSMTPEHPDWKFTMQYTLRFITFAHSGDPNGNNGVIWPMFEEGGQYLNINQTDEIKSHNEDERLQMWMNLLPIKTLANGESSSWYLIVLGILGVVILITLGIIGFLYYKKRSHNSYDTTNRNRSSHTQGSAV